MDLPERRWLETWAFLGRTPPDGLLTELLHRYAEPHRAYHTIAHLLECFDRFDEASGLAERRGEVLLALWFHDAIYDPRASDNEERSARWAREVIAETGGSSEEGRRVEGLILSTKHEALSPAGDSPLLVDIDLAILGADAARFAEYESQIRRGNMSGCPYRSSGSEEPRSCAASSSGPGSTPRSPFSHAMRRRRGGTCEGWSDGQTVRRTGRRRRRTGRTGRTGRVSSDPAA